MKTLNIDIDSGVYEEALKHFKTKENIETFISLMLIQHKRSTDLRTLRYHCIKELKSAIDFVIDCNWANKENVINELPINAHISLELKNKEKNDLGVTTYQFIISHKDKVDVEVLTLIVSVKDSAPKKIVVKNLNFLDVNQEFTLVYDKFPIDKTLCLGSIKYQLYLSLSYMLKVDMNEI